MSTPDPSIETEFDSNFESYQAPRVHCERLVRPAIDVAAEVMSENVSRGDAYPAEVSSLRRPARDQLVRDARRYTSAYRDVDFAGTSAQKIVMAGHQPTLFHPGVWFKNFALDHVGKTTGALAVNLVVDSDVAGSSSVRVPHLDRQTGALRHDIVAFDRRGGGVPYEQSLIEDRELFDAFDRNVAESVSGIVDAPLIHSLWQHARDAINRCGFAGCALAQGRHSLEADLGLQTLEIPQSVVCRGEAFAAFAMQILRDLPRFHDCYNAAAEFYRAAHGIRSKAHPVPNLGRDGDWYEAPFWVYGNQSPKRCSVWVRLSQGGAVMEISDRDKRHRKIHAAGQPAAADAFLALASPEFKIRSRALITTMYARMVLSDLFLHGIGGGKYDQLGDLICRAFWGTDPSRIMVISATVLLPGHQQYPVAEIDDAIRRHNRQLRELDFQPERYAEQGGLDPDKVAAKHQLLQSIPPQGRRRGWHQQITALNQQLASQLQPLRNHLTAEKVGLQDRRREATIWNSREHSFCIYPLEYLTDAYAEMLNA
ncbi:hypothetical protein Mal15_59390 [Stieleria maiorica]|uniref:Uncharacterized protein n=1 Tax=Stieleria maiorica TaxID=2795974 RepID=A0A5B9MS16_9BACT|nr:hypothetical protein [Stieleria maiorica]QEG01858.1 hypothetical protein Mal15_59390 [Stieleria maiorica]